MIDDRVIRERAAALSVPATQVRRDHALSHLIQAMQPIATDSMFIGGTALNRTFLPGLRLSEDLDIHLLRGDPEETLNLLLRGVRFEYPGLTNAGMHAVEDIRTFYLENGEVRIRVQMIRRRQSWAALPSKLSAVRLHYQDLPDAVELLVPTAPSFVAMKLTAYIDRYFARDLYDLWKLTEHRLIDHEGIALAATLLRRNLRKEEFWRCPAESEWRTELLHQVADPGNPQDALQVLTNRLSELIPDW
jgi:predicted nucleotidyltransferase component of viral defense system